MITYQGRTHLALRITTYIIAIVALVSLVVPAVAQERPREHYPTEISGGADAAGLAPRVPEIRPREDMNPGLTPFVPGVSFLAYDFDQNITETGGFVFIPPDPCGAAGQDRVLAVVNVGIECRTKAGVLLWRDALKDFFSPLGASTLGTFTFDPKVVYDHYENRFVVVTLERTATANGDPSDESRILVAVSKTSTPATSTAADWWYLAINSKVVIGGTNHWADYPGFEIDEEAVYITANMFPFAAGSVETRLWIINKGVVGGFYAGGAAAWAIHNPVPAGFIHMTMQPALVFGAAGAGAGIGTYLVGYSSLTNGGPGASEFVQVIRVDNPLGATSFSGQFISVGDLENVGGIYGFPAIPDAPQSGTATLIEVNDSRALDAVWRNNSLWLTTTINPNPANDAINTGSATAHWFRLDTTVPAALALADQGNIGGEDIAANTWTFFPAVAVNGNGDAKFGFAASAQTIFGGAYYAGREAGDPAGTVQASGTVQAGLDYYIRTFGQPRNRWGDYSGAAVDPADDNTFWIFNEYAMVRGTPTPDGDGRWGTAWASCVPTADEQLDFGDAPDQPYPTLLITNGARHTIVPGVFMGASIDPELDGQQSPNADRDDLDGNDDEDGAVLVTPLQPGGFAQVNVTVSIDGWLDVWFDWNQNGSWLDAGELVYSGPVVVGLNPIGFAVPLGPIPGTTVYSRYRFNLNGALPVDGPAADGEVEDYVYQIDEPVELDWGDLPDQPYPTLLVNNGARHVVDPAITMGALIDSEPDGQPSVNADGDDLGGVDDEDGVAFVTPLTPGAGAQVNVTVSIDGWLDVWFDWDQNGSLLDLGEQVYSGPVVVGVNPIGFVVPAAVLPGANIYSRFRFNLTAGPLPPDGPAPDGEVEDYVSIIEQEELDYGDAPDQPYPTLFASNGARHPIDPAIFMGLGIDSEPDGQPTPPADGDDLGGVDDEDGVTFVTPLAIGQGAQVDVVVSAVGWLDVWFDWNQNGSWLDPGDLVYSGNVVVGNNPILFLVPAAALPGGTYARFRYNVAGAALPPDGLGPIGEVEDYRVAVEEQVDIDYGDAPDQPYPTLFASNGARHTIVAGVFMGAQIDPEPDGQPSVGAVGDDLGGVDDEDGVAFVTPLIPGAGAQVNVTVTVDGWLDVWFDWNQNGSWLDLGEQVYSGPVVAGLNPIGFIVPAVAIPGAQVYSRFRYNLVGPLAVTGAAPDGEVEDYVSIIEQEQELDFGDAPDSYRTLLATDGARHVFNANVFMGLAIDTEPDGFPSPLADGDDLNNIDDEDGVTFTTPLSPFNPAKVDILASVAGFVDAWIDFDHDGIFSPADQILAAAPVLPGLNTLNFFVPATGEPAFNTYARFRFSLGGGLNPFGLAPDGEVEDYFVLIEDDEVTGANGDPTPSHYGLNDPVPNPFNPQTTITFALPEASHVTLTVFDVQGHVITRLVDQDYGPGFHDVVWDGRDSRGRQMASGVYLYRIEAGSFVETKRMVLVK